MVSIRYRHVVEDVDRHGNVRMYVRLPGKPKVRLRSVPGSAEFLKEYAAAIEGKAKPKLSPVMPSGSFGAACLAYYASAEFKHLDVSTRNWRRRALDKICKGEGQKPIAAMEARHIRRLRDELADTPGASNNRLKAIKALFKWAIRAELIERNPARDVEKISYATDGHHAWTLEEVEQFERQHPIGTKARLAMALLLYTTGRREDGARLGPQHVRNDRIRFTQAKNEDRNPIEVDIPLHPELARIIAATKASGHLNFLVTEYGKPFSPAGLGNKFREWCNQAGLPHCSAHGLRKAMLTRLADAGASTHQIAAVSGHQDLKEVERYTKAANRKRLASGAFEKLTADEKGNENVPLSSAGTAG